MGIGKRDGEQGKPGVLSVWGKKELKEQKGNKIFFFSNEKGTKIWVEQEGM